MKKLRHVPHHTIEFAVEFMVDREISPKHWLERMLIRRGTRLQAQIKPYVVEAENGLVEVADLFFADGTTTRRVPFEWVLVRAIGQPMIGCKRSWGHVMGSPPRPLLASPPARTL